MSVEINDVVVAQKVNVYAQKSTVMEHNKQYIVKCCEHFSAMYITILTRIQDITSCIITVQQVNDKQYLLDNYAPAHNAML